MKALLRMVDVTKTYLMGGALFREEERWSVFVIEDGVARLRTVRIGRRGGLHAEVLEGLAAGDSVVLYPSDLLEDGASVEPR